MNFFHIIIHLCPFLVQTPYWIALIYLSDVLTQSSASFYTKGLIYICEHDFITDYVEIYFKKNLVSQRYVCG